MPYLHLEFFWRYHRQNQLVHRKAAGLAEQQLCGIRDQEEGRRASVLDELQGGSSCVQALWHTQKEDRIGKTQPFLSPIRLSS